MQKSYESVLATPGSLLRPWGMDMARDHTLSCETCLGIADYVEEEEAFVCRRCGARASTAPWPVASG
jgi:hypothetical protein